MSDLPLSWDALKGLADSGGPFPLDPVQGATSAQATLRLFGHDPAAVRVTLYRDHHAWCPYCQKVWLWLEEKRIPYRTRKVTMFCYGQKEAWYRRIVPSGMLPALEFDGQVITESDRILERLEAAFGPLGAGMNDAGVRPLRQLERLIFRAWCQWLCRPAGDSAEEERAGAAFHAMADRMEAALTSTPGPWLLGGQLTTADLVFVPYLERMNASLAYYKGDLLRRRHPAIHRWFAALEQRSTYLGTQGDFHTHSHDLPPQMGGCFASGTVAQRSLADRIDGGPWPIVEAGEADPETTQPEPHDAARIALVRVVRHRRPLLARETFRTPEADGALRAALTLLATEQPSPPPAGTAGALRSLRDRISVPRDMPLHAARRLRQALEATACLDPRDPGTTGEPIPIRHRYDQDPAPFLTGTRV